MNNSYFMIVTGTTLRGFVNSVSEAMVHGWVPQGGMTIDRAPNHEIIPIKWARDEYGDKPFYVSQTMGSPTYYQAMIKPHG